MGLTLTFSSNQAWLEHYAIPVPESGCWLFTQHLTQSGYGHVTFNGTARRAHRVSYERFNGPIPEGLCVLHRCDVPSCINPKHLFLGTHQDNSEDRDQKGRNGESRLKVCKRGHEFSGDNVKVVTKANGRTYRLCIACDWFLKAKYKAISQLDNKNFGRQRLRNAKGIFLPWEST